MTLVSGDAPTPSAPAAREDDALYFNRELSWLEFNRRVLAEADDESLPPLDRLKFLAIFAGNLDEFFMKRIGGLKLQHASGRVALSPDGRTPEEQLRDCCTRVRELTARAHRVLFDAVVPALAAQGVLVVRHRELDEGERQWCDRYFAASVFPILTPLGLDVSHPFPFISNLSLSLAVAVRAPGSAELRFARVKVPPSLPRWVRLPGGCRFVPLDDLISSHLEQLFPGLEIVEAHAFRVTRAAGTGRHEEAAEDLLESIQEELLERRFAPVVRLEVVPEMPAWMRSLLADELEIAEEDVHEAGAPLGARDLLQLAGIDRPELREEPWHPLTEPRLAPGPDGREPDIFRVIREGDLLVHHPYDSFVTSVQRFLQVAAEDPSVLAIKQTLYRTSKDSPVVRALMEAAERGKQVAVLIELRASFDEARNIEWAEALEEAGAHVAYGVVGYKTHAKVSLVVRQEEDGLRAYAHLATGNYNTDTAELYTDLGLFTCDPEIGADTAQLFNLLTTGQLAERRFTRLAVAPIAMRDRLLALIEREVAHQRAGRGGRIVAKMNALEDPRLVMALYDASTAGVPIDLVVRGVCRLRPGLPGRSATIRVRSIVGRFLEHARIFHFGNAGNPEFYIASADWMSRNLDYRVEAMAPVDDPQLAARLREILDAQLADNCKAWELAADGRWTKCRPAPGEPARSSQRLLAQRTLERAGRA